MEVARLERDIVPAHLAVQAMRDNGYKNAAYAIAELMDNSVQAGATQVELLCGERVEELTHRRRSRIHKIAVLDNGCGMDEDVLQIALQFGNGTHLDPSEQKGIGKFGMGLPSASISQCRRVDVWSWQDGIESALYTYIDIDKVKSREQKKIPDPVAESVPFLWRKTGQSFGTTGTLVVWSQLDRVIWKTAKAIIDNSELLIGRMYRRFLEENRVRIIFHPFDLENPDQPSDDVREAHPNDPLYLMERTSCPAPYHEQPMFELWGDGAVTQRVAYNGGLHDVRVTFSVAKPEAREGRNPGALPHGRHAAKNVGVSIMRAGRELELDQSWTIQYDPRERWWGVEIEFPPALDDLFGLTNNKQTARNLKKIDQEDLLANGETPEMLLERLREENDPIEPILRISKLIETNLSVLRNHIKTQKQGEDRRRRRHELEEDEEHATRETKKRQSEGYRGQSDEDENLPGDQKKQALSQLLETEGLTEAAANDLAARTVDFGLKYTFIEAELETAAFFTVRPKAGTIVITLNTSHPAYKNLYEVLDRSIDEDDVESLTDRFRNARSGLRLLLMAWARYEDELEGQRRDRAQEARFDWGRVARQFLERND